MRNLILAIVIWAGFGSASLMRAEEPPLPLERIRQSVSKALPPLREAIDGHSAKHSCFTCHNHGVPLVALATARDRGFDVTKVELDEQIAFIVEDLERNRKNFEKGRGPGPAPAGGEADNTGYALLALDIAGYKPDTTTTVVVVSGLYYTLKFQANLGHWATQATRFPTESSSFTTTALALRGISRFGTPDQRDAAKKRVDASREWLQKTEPKETEDRVFRLLALNAVDAPAEVIAKGARDLIDTQGRGGGWAQNSRMESDAYATATALVALHWGAGMPATDPVYRRGIAYLLESQLPDGTWHVRTRSRPVQKYFETGFPHGKDQFLSCAATAWATTALALAVPKK
jgi:Prenyltransferase and squalene oxidase repeat